jgi:ribosomal protein S20
MTLNFTEAVTQIDNEIAKLQRVRSVLAEFSTNGVATVAHASRGKSRLSPAAKERIAAAQRKRWAKFHREKRG